MPEDDGSDRTQTVELKDSTDTVKLKRPTETESPEGDKSESDKKKSTAQKHEKKPRSILKRVFITLLVIAVLAAAGVGGYFYWEYAKQFESTDDAFVDGHIVQMDAKISGYVVAMLVDDNQLVQAGDVMVQIDPRDYQAQLDQMIAAQAAAQAKVDQAKAGLNESKAALSTAKANVTSASAATQRDEAELGRYKKLRGSGSITPEEYDVANASAKSSSADEAAMRARVGEAEAVIATNQAALVTAQAEYEQAVAGTRAAQITLGYTKITAPITGRVTRRTVEKGNLVQQGTSLFAIVEQNMWVTANFKETQLTYMKKDQAVSISIDTYPDRKLAGHIDSFQRGSGQRFSLLPPENATGNYVKVVQRVPVKILFSEPPPSDMILGPGMSIVPTVKVR